MELRYGHLCDYAALGAAGKLTLVGLFDQLFSTKTDEPIGIPMSYLVFKLECSIAEGSHHAIRVRLKDADEETLMESNGTPMEWDLGTQPFKLSGPGRPLSRINLVGLQGLSVPGHGDYFFEVIVDGQPLAHVPFFVTAPPPQG